jgi:RsmE family RNA methyltransferase
VECRMIDATRFEVMHVESETYPVPRILGIGVLENRDRMEFAVEKAVELGATHIIPLITDHSGFARTTSNRLVAKAIAALTQCGRLWLPEIHAPTLLHDALRWAKESFNAHLLYGVASESGSSPIKNVESEPVLVTNDFVPKPPLLPF